MPISTASMADLRYRGAEQTQEVLRIGKCELRKAYHDLASVSVRPRELVQESAMAVFLGAEVLGSPFGTGEGGEVYFAGRGP
jgi:hypothetical protein